MEILGITESENAFPVLVLISPVDLLSSVWEARKHGTILDQEKGFGVGQVV